MDEGARVAQVAARTEAEHDLALLPRGQVEHHLHRQARIEPGADSPMRILLRGPQGSGKGTQAKRIAAGLGVPHVATGDILRDAVGRGTELGRRVQPILEQGELVPDELMIELQAIKEAVQPSDLLYVADAMTGQDAVNVADDFQKKIGLTGHSRNGKQAVVAAAFDERIGAVVPSSGNTGGADPWRYTTDMFVNESIELLTGAQPHWFHPRLRFFAGREDKLPVDQNLLMAAIAPRGFRCGPDARVYPVGCECGRRAVGCGRAAGSRNCCSPGFFGESFCHDH